MIASRMILLAACLTAGCSPATPPPKSPSSSALWCLVETNSLDARQNVARHAQPAPAIQLLREHLPAGPDTYSDRFSDTTKAGLPVVVSGERLADGTWLVRLSGAAEWWEWTCVLLQVEQVGAQARVDSAHLEWGADVPPYHAWAALDWGWIRLDDAEFQREGVVRLAFELNGELLDPLHKPQDPPQRVRAGGTVTLRLRDDKLQPLPGDLRETFERVAAAR